jgi:hypothetical protein
VPGTSETVIKLIFVVLEAMFRRLPFLFIFSALFALTACAGNQGGSASTNTPFPLTVPGLEQETPAVASAVLTITAQPSETAVPPTASPAPTDTPTAIPVDLSLMPDGVVLLPVPKIYEGDLVTFKIEPVLPEGVGSNDVRVQITVDGQQIVNEILNWRSLGGQTYGLYEWIWNTAGKAGPHAVSVILDPDNLVQIGDENPNNNQVIINVTVNPRSDLPPLDADAVWITESSDCCTLHAVSGTAAHRDLTYLLSATDAAFSEASSQLAEPLSKKYDVYFIDRVLGQGGYASGAMVISYLDRNYTGGGVYEVLVHEAVHLIDHTFAPNRITFLAEGVAVWATGGHYQVEDLGRRVAALIEMGAYVPLAELIDNFYPTQHEISYLQAGGLIDYLVEIYGWEQVRNFYSDTTVYDGNSLSASVDMNLQLYFNKSLAEIEAEWINYVQGLPREAGETADLQTTIRYYEVMRQYQAQFDPSAYYLNAWLPPPAEVERLGITADLTRHPETAGNIALESLLLSAYASLEAGDYGRANGLLDSVIRVLDNNGAFLDPLAGTYLDIVRTTSAMDYQVQQIEVDGTVATVLVTRPNRVNLIRLDLVLDNDSWILTQ